MYTENIDGLEDAIDALIDGPVHEWVLDRITEYTVEDMDEYDGYELLNQVINEMLQERIDEEMEAWGHDEVARVLSDDPDADEAEERALVYEKAKSEVFNDVKQDAYDEVYKERYEEIYAEKYSEFYLEERARALVEYKDDIKKLIEECKTETNS